MSPSLDRRRSAIELAVLMTAMLAHLWTDSRAVLPKPVRQTNTVLLAALAVGILIRQRPSRADVGFAPPRGWWDGLPTLLLGTIAYALALWGIGWKAGTLGEFVGLWEWQFENFHQQGLQQVLLQVFLFPRCRAILITDDWKPTWMAAGIFALLHAPNVPLMAFSGIASLGWVEWFRRHPNLPAVWISHAFLAGVGLATIHPFLGRLRVGIGYLWSSRDALP